MTLIFHINVSKAGPLLTKIDCGQEGQDPPVSFTNSRAGFTRAFLIALLVAAAICENKPRHMLKGFAIVKLLGDDWVTTFWNSLSSGPVSKVSRLPEWYPWLVRLIGGTDGRLLRPSTNSGQEAIVMTEAWERVTVKFCAGEDHEPIAGLVALLSVAQTLLRNGKWRKASTNLNDYIFHLDSIMPHTPGATILKTRKSLLDREVTLPGEPQEESVKKLLSTLDPRERFHNLVAGFRQELDSGIFSHLERETPDYQLAMFMTQIGIVQRLKQDNEDWRESVRIRNDRDFLLEATQNVFQVAEEHFPELGASCSRLIAALEVLGTDKGAYGLPDSEVRNSWIDEIEKMVEADRICVFLHYFVFLCLERPGNKRVAKMRALLKKNHFFRLLSTYDAGINFIFYDYLGADFFCRAGEPFRNRHWQHVPLCKDDTLRRLYRENYPATKSFDDCIAGMLRANSLPGNLSPDLQLCDMPETKHLNSVIIGAPVPQQLTHNQAIIDFDNWLSSPKGAEWLMRMRPVRRTTSPPKG